MAEAPSVSVIREAIWPEVQLSMVVMVSFFAIRVFVRRAYFVRTRLGSNASVWVGKSK